MDSFVGYMRNPAGRTLRIVLGLFLIWWGFWGHAGWVLGVIGFAPLAAGLFNFCLFAPFFGRTIWGEPRTT